MTKDEKFKEAQSKMSDLDLIVEVERQVLAMCKDGGKSFTMSIPCQIRDTDMVIMELVRRYKQVRGVGIGIDLKKVGEKVH